MATQRPLQITVGPGAAELFLREGWRGRDVSLLLGASGGPSKILVTLSIIPPILTSACCKLTRLYPHDTGAICLHGKNQIGGLFYVLLGYKPDIEPLADSHLVYQRRIEK